MNQKGIVPMTSTGIRMPVEQKEMLQRIAALERRQTSDCIRIAIEEYVARKKKEHNIEED